MCDGPEVQHQSRVKTSDAEHESYPGSGKLTVTTLVILYPRQELDVKTSPDKDASVPAITIGAYSKQLHLD